MMNKFMPYHCWNDYWNHYRPCALYPPNDLLLDRDVDESIQRHMQVLPSSVGSSSIRGSFVSTTKKQVAQYPCLVEKDSSSFGDCLSRSLSTSLTITSPIGETANIKESNNNSNNNNNKAAKAAAAALYPHLVPRKRTRNHQSHDLHSSQRRATGTDPNNEWEQHIHLNEDDQRSDNSKERNDDNDEDEIVMHQMRLWDPAANTNTKNTNISTPRRGPAPHRHRHDNQHSSITPALESAIGQHDKRGGYRIKVITPPRTNETSFSNNNNNNDNIAKDSIKKNINSSLLSSSRTLRRRSDLLVEDDDNSINNNNNTALNYAVLVHMDLLFELHQHKVHEEFKQQQQQQQECQQQQPNKRLQHRPKQQQGQSMITFLPKEH